MDRLNGLLLAKTERYIDPVIARGEAEPAGEERGEPKELFFLSFPASSVLRFVFCVGAASRLTYMSSPDDTTAVNIP